MSDETVGAEPKTLVPVVGIWRIESDAGKKVLAVDGRQWKEGQSSAGLADKARALYGERYAEFLDRVQAYAYFPYVVAKDVADFRGGELSVRFEGISGRIDQGAGLLFNLKPNGDYLTVRANPLENNLVLWKFEKGRRSSVKWIRNTPTASHEWHDLRAADRRHQAASFLGWKALPRLHVARTGLGTSRTVVEGGQLRLFQRLCGASRDVELKATAGAAARVSDLASRKRRAASRAIAAGAWSGSAKHELTLISHRT